MRLVCVCVFYWQYKGEKRELKQQQQKKWLFSRRDAEVANHLKGFKIQRYSPLCSGGAGGSGGRAGGGGGGMRSMGQSELTLSIISVAENMEPDNSWHT